MMNAAPRLCICVCLALLGACQVPAPSEQSPEERPNIVLIYADDLGYGDLSSYGATQVQTPAIDQLAEEGILFTDAHAPSATCTPSRYALLTGEYAWRREGTGIARGDASMIIEPGRATLPSKLREAGYTTGVIGKWHLGLGGEGGPDWNGEIKPGPLEIGFDEAFLIPATGDRVPTVYVENHRVVGLDPNDPIEVSFREPVGDEPTGRENPELLKMHPSHGHDMTIVNGISRIGYMKGGTAARWVDEDMADVITEKAVQFIDKHKESPFFLFFSLHDIHVPRVPHPRFVGKSGMGPRGDVILQTDWCVEEVMKALDQHGLAENTIVIFTSDNGPVVDDGYEDQAVELLGDHAPAGVLRGGKYSAFEAGTRVPFILKWTEQVEPGTSDALVSQVDLMASLAGLSGVSLAPNEGVDSFDQLPTLLGESITGRDYLIEHNAAGTLSIIKDSWKFIEPSTANPYNARTDIELGNNPEPQLYNLAEDLGEQHNVASDETEKLEELSSLLETIKSDGRSRPSN
ncbi:MAG: arylsulfatase [Rhodothermaceae bacterium]|nr:arylsulfatase [Rhodothermaceae bacterium]